MKSINYIKTHPCFDAKGKGTDCSNCIINHRGFCKTHIRVLRKIIDDINIKYYFPVMDKEDIISSTIDGIMKNLNKMYLITNYQAMFRKIYKNKIADFFIYKYNKDDNLDKTFEIEMTIHFENNEEQEIIECLKEIMHIHKCIPFMLTIYDGYREGLNDKALAVQKEISYDSFRQRKNRCKSTVQEILSEMCEVNYV